MCGSPPIVMVPNGRVILQQAPWFTHTTACGSCCLGMFKGKKILAAIRRGMSLRRINER